MSSEPKNQPVSPREDARFEPLMRRTEAHWREFNPKLVKLLEKKGILRQRLESAVESGITILHQCEERGLAPDQARELAYEDLLLPAESE